MELSKYVEYVNSHSEEIVNYVNACFEESRELIRKKLIRKMRKWLTPLPEHYRWKPGGGPRDHSGRLVEEGKVDINQTVMDFLCEEYDGSKEATYTSGMGWRYNTYGRWLQCDTMEMAEDIMFPAIRRYIEAKFAITLSDEEFGTITDMCDGFDCIYDDSIASDFFFGEGAVEFVGIGDLKLAEIIAQPHSPCWR